MISRWNLCYCISGYVLEWCIRVSHWKHDPAMALWWKQKKFGLVVKILRISVRTTKCMPTLAIKPTSFKSYMTGALPHDLHRVQQLDLVLGLGPEQDSRSTTRKITTSQQQFISSKILMKYAILSVRWVWQMQNPPSSCSSRSSKKISPESSPQENISGSITFAIYIASSCKKIYSKSNNSTNQDLPQV